MQLQLGAFVSVPARAGCSVTVYGRLSRLTANPRPRKYPPVIEPAAASANDPERSDRWCFVGRHRSTDPERWEGDRGCSKHPVAKGRPTTRTGRAAKTDSCCYCKALKPHSAFALMVVSLGARVCDECAPNLERVA